MEKKTKAQITALAERIGEILEDRKAIDVEVIDVSDKTTLADLFIICSGNSTTQVRALATEVEQKVREEFQLEPKYTEGFSARQWVLIDYIDIVVHILLREEREYYSLERLWQSYPEGKD